MKHSAAWQSVDLRRNLRRLSLHPTLIRPASRRIVLTNEEIYDLIEFP